MHAIIDACLSRTSAVLISFLMLLFVGSKAFYNIPKELDPDIQIPVIYVSVSYPGISPEDSERLMVRPLENALRSIIGIKKIRSFAGLDYASVMLEFDAGFDSKKAIADVRDKVNETKRKLPQEAKEPEVTEINLSRFPVINVIVHGHITERELVHISRHLKDEIEQIPNVLEVVLAGTRDDVVEIIIHPSTLQTYGITTDTIQKILKEGNSMIAAGEMSKRDGAFSIKAPSLLISPEDFLNFPVITKGDSIVRLRDIAEVRFNFSDPQSFARVNGEKAIVIEVSKRSGTNIIETIDAVKAKVNATAASWPDGMHVTFAQDQSTTIRDMLSELENSIIFAIILAMIPIILTMGGRSAFLVGMAIPGSFMFGIILLYMWGLTINIVVLFSLILSVGMLVDAAIVVCEYADRKMVTGMGPKEAYRFAAKRMCWPVIAGVATHVVVFIPLLFWPGIMGKFMRYMPITILVTMTGSMLMAFVFLPALGSKLGKPKSFPPELVAATLASELDGNISELRGFTRYYGELLKKVLRYPGWFVLSVTGAMILIILLYALIGPGKEFFPQVEPEQAMVSLRARGNLSVWQKDALLKEVEARIGDMGTDIRVMYAKSYGYQSSSHNATPDTIASIQLEFQNWQVRRKAAKILEEIRTRTADMAGLTVVAEEERGGPQAGKPVQIEMRSKYQEPLTQYADKMMQFVRSLPDLQDIEDNFRVPEIEWELDVNRELAARYGIGTHSLAQHLQLFTRGLVVTTIRPESSDDEVDVIVRFPEEKRTITDLMALQINTPIGAVPLSQFVTLKSKQKQGIIQRLNGSKLLSISANLKPGKLADTQVKTIKAWIKKNPPPPQVSTSFGGDEEDQQESATFLANAFGLALFAMAMMMIIQFNSIFKMLIIMSAVFLSTGGVLLGLLITYQPFGIVMCGVGIIALAGTIVNNNIIFIDTFDELANSKASLEEILLRTGTQRLRPIILTAGTGVLGLLPMVFALNIDFIAQDISYNAPGSQWWRQLSTTLAGGLAFATVLTLFYTPCLLILGERGKQWLHKKFPRLFNNDATTFHAN